MPVTLISLLTKSHHVGILSGGNMPISHDDNNTLTVNTKRRMTRNQASKMITPRKAITRVSDTLITNDVDNYDI